LRVLFQAATIAKLAIIVDEEQQKQLDAIEDEELMGLLQDLHADNE
jgi:hypothetical protein